MEAVAATPQWRATVAGASIAVSTRADGDLNADQVAPTTLAGRWRALTGGVEVTWLDEASGAMHS